MKALAWLGRWALTLLAGLVAFWLLCLLCYVAIVVLIFMGFVAVLKGILS